MFGYFLLLPGFTEIPVFHANSADPDQMLHSAASDLGLHCLLRPIYGTQGLNRLSFPLKLIVPN